MTHTTKIIGLIAALAVIFGGPALATAPVWAQVTESEYFAPKRLEVAMVDNQIQGFTRGDVSVTEISEVPFTPECIGLSDALMVDGGSRALCRW